MLDELAIGMSIHETMTRHAGSLEVLDKQFADYLEEKANAYGAEIDWTKPDSQTLRDSGSRAAWIDQFPETFYSQQQEIRRLLEQEQWEAAVTAGERLRDACPEFVGADNAYQFLAAAFRGIGDTEGERAVLEDWAGRDAEALNVYQQLMELAEEASDWEALERNARRAAAVNPLRPSVQQALATSAEKLGRPQRAIQAYQALLALGPIDLAEVHYRLATAYHEVELHEEARRHVLQSLEEAPRFRAAHRLLLDLIDSDSASAADDLVPSSDPPLETGEAPQEEPLKRN